MNVSLATLTATIRRAIDLRPVDVSRIERAAGLIACGHVEKLDEAVYAVRSQTDAARVYTVTPEGCECVDASRRSGWCKHQYAVRILLAAQLDVERQRELEARSRANADRVALAYANAHRRAA